MKKQQPIDYALKLLSYRPRSENEIRFRLKLKKVEPQEVDKIVVKLIKLNYLNDTEFVSWWQKQRDDFRPRSSRIIKLELFKKGVKKDIIDQVLDTSEETELKRAKKALSKKRFTDKQKIYRFLSSRGFSWGIIKQLTLPES